MSETRTPVWVRGKRGVKQPPKARRRLVLQSETRPVVPPVIAARRLGQLSQLELLPTEMLQTIFLLSRNVNLPLVSKTFANVMSGAFLQKEFMVSAFAGLLSAQSQPSKQQVRQLEGILPCRFCTWTVLKSCFLDNHAAILEMAGRSPDTPIPQDLSDDGLEIGSIMLEYSMRLPSKVLHGPWTSDRIKLLKFCRSLTEPFTILDDPTEVVRISSYGGFLDAIREGSTVAIDELWAIGAVPTANFMRVAVLEGGCQRLMVLNLLLYTFRATSRPSSARDKAWPVFDAMDRVLWNWAKTAEQGPWLIEALRSYNNGDIGGSFDYLLKTEGT